MCRVVSCERPSRSRGMCHNHYEMSRRNGAPVARERKAPAFIRAAVASATDDCIEWPYSRSGSGYGQVWTETTMRPAHRVALEMAKGPPPTPEHEAAHAPTVCHNKLCINPRHLRWDTPKGNRADKLIDGTTNRGERCGSAKLSCQQVLAIRADSRSQRAIARDYNVSQSHVSAIKTRARWSHI